MAILIEIFGSLYGAGPNMRPGCVASFAEEGHFSFRGELEDLPEAFDAWRHTPVMGYPRRYLKFVEYRIDGGQRSRTIMDLPVEMAAFMARIRKEVAP